MDTSDTTFGITLEQVRAFLGYVPVGSPGNHPRDPILAVLLAGAIATLKSLTGRNLQYGLYRDTFQGLDQRTYLHEPPVDVIISIFNGGQLVDGEQFKLFSAQGYLYFQNGWWLHGNGYWTEGLHGLCTVEYIGGYKTLPADMVLAVLNGIQSADNYQKQISNYGGTVKRISVYDVGVTDLAVPKEGSVNVMEDTMSSQLSSYTSESAGLAAYRLSESEYLGVYQGSPSYGGVSP